MYPAILPSDGLPDGFIAENEPEKALLIPIDDVEAIRKEALAEWLSALSK